MTARAAASTRRASSVSFVSRTQPTPAAHRRRPPTTTTARPHADAAT
jgi:hypothetical protein